jgi:AcrR family transcriptional regulator
MEGKGDMGEAGRLPESEGRLRRVRRTEVRARLLEAAGRCFAESGYEGTSLERIALAAGFSKGAVYSNFANKEELFFDLMAERIEERASSIASSLSAAGEGSPRELAEAAGRKFEALVAADPAWQELFLEFWLHCVRNEALRARFAERRREMRRSLGALASEEARKSGCSLALGPEEAATVFLALSNGLGIEGLIDPELDLEPLMGRMLGLLFRAD